MRLGLDQSDAPTQAAFESGAKASRMTVKVKEGETRIHPFIMDTAVPAVVVPWRIGGVLMEGLTKI